jgi:hypothetical protein
MADTTTQPQKGFWSKLFGDVNVNTEVGLTQSSLMQAGAVLFITAVLIFLAYFTFKKFMK